MILFTSEFLQSFFHWILLPSNLQRCIQRRVKHDLFWSAWLGHFTLCMKGLIILVKSSILDVWLNTLLICLISFSMAVNLGTGKSILREMLRKTFNLFLANVAILSLLKTPENLWSFLVFSRGYKMGTLARKWLTKNQFLKILDVKIYLKQSYPHFMFVLLIFMGAMIVTPRRYRRRLVTVDLWPVHGWCLTLLRK